jgi:lyso-ornithine lipid O-acyltransferase
VPMVRALTKLAALAAFTAIVYPILVTSRAIVGRTSARGIAIRRRLVRFWARGVARIFGMRLHCEGHEPHQPFLLVSNHLGYADVIAYAATVDGVFVAKSDLASWPVVGALCRSADVVFVDRSARRDVTRVNQAIEEALGRGEGVILFPEGTSTRGERVLPFKPSLLEVAARGRLGVRVAGIRYATAPPDEPASESVCWWGDMTFPGHFFALLGMRRIDAWIRHCDGVVVDDDRKRLAVALRAKVLEVFEPTARIESPPSSPQPQGESFDHVHGELASKQ